MVKRQTISYFIIKIELTFTKRSTFTTSGTPTCFPPLRLLKISSNSALVVAAPAARCHSQGSDAPREQVSSPPGKILGARAANTIL